jgi:hypothetical protein
MPQIIHVLCAMRSAKTLSIRSFQSKIWLFINLFLKFFFIIYIIISLFCLCVWPAIDSAPGCHKHMRSVSLEPVWPEGVPSSKNFFEIWPVAELPKKKVMPLMLLYGKNFSAFKIDVWYAIILQVTSSWHVIYSNLTNKSRECHEFNGWSREFDGCFTKN